MSSTSSSSSSSSRSSATAANDLLPNTKILETQYISQTGENILNADITKDKQLRESIARANEHLAAADSKGGKTHERVAEQLAKLTTYGKDVVAADPKKRKKRGKNYRSASEFKSYHSEKEADLGPMLCTGQAKCRELAAFTHLLLADRGIPSKIESGVRKVRSDSSSSASSSSASASAASSSAAEAPAASDDEVDESRKHAWLRLPTGHVLDPMKGHIHKEDSDFDNKWETVSTQALAEPKTPIEPGDLKKAAKAARRQVKSAAKASKQPAPQATQPIDPEQDEAATT